MVWSCQVTFGIPVMFLDQFYWCEGLWFCLVTLGIRIMFLSSIDQFFCGGMVKVWDLAWSLLAPHRFSFKPFTTAKAAIAVYESLWEINNNSKRGVKPLNQSQQQQQQQQQQRLHSQGCHCCLWKSMRNKQPALSLLPSMQCRPHICHFFSTNIICDIFDKYEVWSLQTLFSAAAELKTSSHIINQIHFILSCLE